MHANDVVPNGFRRFVLPRQPKANDQSVHEAARNVWRHIATRHGVYGEEKAAEQAPLSVVTAWAAFHACLPVSRVSVDRMLKRIDSFIEVVQPSPLVRSYVIANLLQYTGISDEARGRAMGKLSCTRVGPMLMTEEFVLSQYISIYDSPNMAADTRILHYVKDDVCHTFRFQVPSEHVQFECDSRFPPAGHWRGKNTTFVLLLNTSNDTILLVTHSGMVISAPSSELYNLLSCNIL